MVVVVVVVVVAVAVARNCKGAAMIYLDHFGCTAALAESHRRSRKGYIYIDKDTYRYIRLHVLHKDTYRCDALEGLGSRGARRRSGNGIIA